jgi:hypothetical protein
MSRTPSSDHFPFKTLSFPYLCSFAVQLLRLQHRTWCKMTLWFAIVSGQMWFSEPLANIFWIRHMYSSLLFHCSLSYWCVLRREWMGCWGLLGWLLLVMKWIIPENSLPSTSKFGTMTSGIQRVRGSHRPERSRSPGARTPVAPRRGHLGKVGKPAVWLILISIVIPPKKIEQ